MRKRKELLKLCLYLATIMLIFYACGFVSSGSDVDAEYYRFPISRTKLISLIDKFKEEHPEYRLIKISAEGVETEILDRYSDNTYILHFYFKDTSQVILCVIHGSDDLVPISIGLVSVGKSGNYRRVNTKELTK
jgi:hypothetical protein